MNVRSNGLIAAAFVCFVGMSVEVVAQDWFYRIREGDTLWKLCLKHSNRPGCWLELAKYNNIADDRAIEPGDEIRFPRTWMIAAPTVGEARNVQGDVLYDEKSSGDTVPLVAGQQLSLGGRIVTGEGTALITFGSDSSLLIRPHSELTLDSLSSGPGPGQSAELSLDTGDVDVKVKPDSDSRFQISTPAAIAAVRGTQYRVNSSNDGVASVRSEVLTGAVEVQGMGAILVPAGFGVKAKKGQPIEKPRKLLPPPVFQQARIDSTVPVDIQWRSDPGAVTWQLDLLLGEEGGELYESYAVDTPQIVLNDLGEACYRLVLRGVDEAGFNGLESQLPLCIVGLISAPTDISINRLDGARKQYQVAWSPVAGASEYRLDVATDASFDTVISSQMATEPQAELTIPDADRFSVRVSAIDAHANASKPSRSVEHVEPNWIIPAGLTAVLLAVLLL